MRAKRVPRKYAPSGLPETSHKGNHPNPPRCAAASRTNSCGGPAERGGPPRIAARQRIPCPHVRKRQPAKNGGGRGLERRHHMRQLYLLIGVTQVTDLGAAYAPRH